MSTTDLKAGDKVITGLPEPLTRRAVMKARPAVRAFEKVVRQLDHDLLRRRITRVEWTTRLRDEYTRVRKAVVRIETQELVYDTTRRILRDRAFDLVKLRRRLMARAERIKLRDKVDGGGVSV